MVVKVVATPPCLQWSPKSRNLNDGVLVSRTTTWLGSMSSKLSRTRSFEYKAKQRAHYSIRRACSASFDHSSSSSSSGDEEFSRKIQELALRFQLAGENDESTQSESEVIRGEYDGSPLSTEEQWAEIQAAGPPDWNPVSIEMKANCVDLPLSLRMIKRKKNQLKENFLGAGESAYCSVKKAFSSMVFIIRELHSHSLQMREVLFYEDLQGILVRVQQEMHASFVWLFQQVFSHTPTLMVYIMILLANFTVHSMSNSAAFAAVSPPSVTATVEEREITTTTTSTTSTNFDSVTRFSVTSSSSGSNTASVGGNNGGGNKFKPVASGMDGDGWMNNSSANINRPILPDGVSPFSTREEESVSGQEEIVVWNSILDEANKMQGQIRDKCLEDDVTEMFVSPVTAKIATDDYEDYFRTELLYQTELAQEPNNVLLLANYAQFLYLVVHDYDRAEDYFKRATGVEPKDAEAHSKYAQFLWQVRNDLWAAEETYLEAISADPSNSFYAANYAHFLWNTGGEDTCFPLDSADDETLDS